MDIWSGHLSLLPAFSGIAPVWQAGRPRCGPVPRVGQSRDQTEPGLLPEWAGQEGHGHHLGWWVEQQAPSLRAFPGAAPPLLHVREDTSGAERWLQPPRPSREASTRGSWPLGGQGRQKLVWMLRETLLPTHCRCPVLQAHGRPWEGQNLRPLTSDGRSCSNCLDQKQCSPVSAQGHEECSVNHGLCHLLFLKCPWTLPGRSQNGKRKGLGDPWRGEWVTGALWDSLQKTKPISEAHHPEASTYKHTLDHSPLPEAKPRLWPRFTEMIQQQASLPVVQLG